MTRLHPRGLERLLMPLVLLVAALFATPAAAQEFPQLTGRVIDNANLLSAADEAELTQKLAALEQSTSRQLVVATVPDLQGYPIEDYGYRLGRQWGIGQSEANNGAILLIAPNERKVRIEVGYGLEPILTDALSSVIINRQVVPAFKQGDFAGGIKAGADAIIAQLQAPPEEAEQRVLAASAEQQQARSGGGQSILPLIFWGFVLFFILIPMLRGGRRGRRYRRRGGLPIVIWGPGMGGGWGGGGFGGGGGGFGGFGGGGGSFGGGGASGGW